jgi:hypothetical protein
VGTWAGPFTYNVYTSSAAADSCLEIKDSGVRAAHPFEIWV